jgi:hypothetical protein
VVVAVPAVRVVQVPVHEVVEVVPMGNRVVPAAGSVRMALGVAAARVRGSARAGVRLVDADRTLIDVVVVHAVQVTVVEVVGVASVSDRGMTAPGTVGVRVVGVNGVFAHGLLSLPVSL